MLIKILVTKILGTLVQKKRRVSYANINMIHLNKNCNAAIADLQIICKSLNVTLLNSMAVKAKDIVGAKKKPLYNFTPVG